MSSKPSPFHSIFHNQRKHLTSDELYIGNKKLRTKESGGFDVVPKDDQGLRVPSTVLVWFETENKSSVVVPALQVSASVNWEPEPAVFSIVGEVGEFDSQLGCHGGYKIRPNIHSLTDATLTLALRRPRSPLYGPEFNAATANLDMLTEARRNIEVGWRLQRVTRLSSPDAVLNNAKYLDPYNSSGTAGWKVHPSAKDELAEVVKNRTHEVVPLQSFTFDGKPIAPGGYRTKLPNRLVHVKFIMRHEVDSRDETDKFFAEIVSVRVLAPIELMGGKVVNGTK
ncbi:hypothetical protein K435DRAFT_811792 [Dendrothele bispora CBS 962.96]|uniref:Uncharacterized protein n=1 Tax=Dendrothele bispora (strain CBS 962.96) TaxID=1314807 RepID=A0A4S8KQZ2_DENBC|nr:hypothetical protein K435DRAFT_811792 [Dendrothele bispora CBS 962.96]